MSEFLKPILEFLKLTPRYLIAVGLVAGLVLFGSDKFRDTLGIAKFAEDYRPVLGVLFLSSVVLLFVAIGSGGVTHLQRAWRKRKAFQRITQRLHRLTEDEKQILRYYIVKDTRSNVLRVENGVVNGLVADGILWRSASLGSVIEGFAHNISDVAWDYLHVYPNLLDGTTDTIFTDRRRRFGY